MPRSTSVRILRPFQTVPPHNALIADYQGPFNKLLYTLFPPDSNFMVVPKTRAHSLSVFEVHFENRPIFIVEVKPPSTMSSLFAREEADVKMRECFRDCIEQCPVPILRGVSAIGTRLAFYTLDIQHLEAGMSPPLIPRDPIRVNDTAPRERWSLDLLTEEGEVKFRGVVEEIKAECEALGLET